ncbi:hypothetical protein D3C77_710540 [compost metagenome]
MQASSRLTAGNTRSYNVRPIGVTTTRRVVRSNNLPPMRSSSLATRRLKADVVMHNWDAAAVYCPTRTRVQNARKSSMS